MSGVGAMFNRDGRPVDAACLRDMGEALDHRGPDRAGAWRRSNIALLHRALHTTAECLGGEMPLETAAGMVITADARLDNRDELSELLGIAGHSARSLSDAALVAHAYARWREKCPEKLLGDFAFCLWDSTRRLLFCARDHMGVKPLYYHLSSGGFMAASEIGPLLRAGAPKRLDVDRVVQYLMPSFEDTAVTFYEGIARLPPAHSLTVTRDGFRLHRYWKPEPQDELRYRTDAEYAEALRGIFFQAVKCRLRAAVPAGSLLSGGIDSSSIACAARRLRGPRDGEELPTFSAVFPGTPQCDETGYIQEVLAGGGLRGHFVDGGSSSPLADFREALEHDDEPYYAPNLFLHRALYRAARARGVRILLDGFDGDVAVGHGLARITELARGCRFIAAGAELRATARRLNRPVWRVARQRVVGPMLPGRMKAVRRACRSIRTEGDFAFSPALAERLARLRESVPVRTVTTVKQEDVRALSGGIIPFALEVADQAAARLHLEPRYPFFDKRLLEFCLALPSDQKLRGGWTRWAMRQAMQGVLPAAIQWRPGKSDLSANFVKMLLKDPGLEAGDYRSLAPYVEVRSVERLHRRTIVEHRSSDALALWRVATLGAWLRSSGVAS